VDEPGRAQLLAEVSAEAPRPGAAVRLNIAVAHQLGLPLADLQCMGLLADGPSASGYLAAQLGLTSGAMTRVLDRLEHAGYVTRAADPSDRRRVTSAADPAGLSRLADCHAPIGGEDEPLPGRMQPRRPGRRAGVHARRPARRRRGDRPDQAAGHQARHPPAPAGAA
jgi:DNA-binding MarR family transcriptional regulator